MHRAGRNHVMVFGVHRIDPPLQAGEEPDFVGLKIMLTRSEALAEVQRLQGLYNSRVSSLKLNDSERARYVVTQLRLRFTDIETLADTHLQ
jgi:hypothetical protein